MLTLEIMTGHRTWKPVSKTVATLAAAAEKAASYDIDGLIANVRVKEDGKVVAGGIGLWNHDWTEFNSTAIAV